MDEKDLGDDITTIHATEAQIKHRLTELAAVTSCWWASSRAPSW